MFLPFTFTLIIHASFGNSLQSCECNVTTFYKGFGLHPFAYIFRYIGLNSCKNYHKRKIIFENPIKVLHFYKIKVL